MRFTSDLARDKFASMVIHYSNTPPQPVSDLAEVLATRMRELTGGRLWMGAHLRRGDCKCTTVHISLLPMTVLLTDRSRPPQCSQQSSISIWQCTPLSRAT